ncbi:MAG TPA: GGDEF domain-containing protein [bacterium]|nr:GGDEF domain-containing protein [bacterium]
MTDKGFLTVAETMVPTSASVNIDDSVAAAAEILRREGLMGLPVCSQGRVVGLVTPRQLLREPPYRPVGTVMTREIAPATPALSLLQTRALMVRQGVEVLPVIDAGAIVGQISMVAVLNAQGQQTDPLTGLAWATALRSWASAALASGREVGILFVDLDNFGEVNKVLGHVAGDEILRAITHLLGDLIDPSADLLCRYGGDEFVIATTRRADDVRALAARIEGQVAVPVDMNGDPRRLTVSVGVAGGRRAEGRRATHVSATVEDLLRLASRESTAVKKAKGTIAAAAVGTALSTEAVAPHDAQLSADQAQAAPLVAPARARSTPTRWHRIVLGAVAAAASFALGVAQSASVLHGLGALAPRHERPASALPPPVFVPARRPDALRQQEGKIARAAVSVEHSVAEPHMPVPGYVVSIGTFATGLQATRTMRFVRSKGYVVFVVPRGAEFEVATSRLGHLVAIGVADALEDLGFPAHPVLLR